MELTILMPCLNEALTVETCVRKARAYLEKRSIAGEVLVADNGSTDGSQTLAAAAGARVIEVDADDSYDFTDLDGFVDRLRRGFKLVIGNRFKGGIKPGAMPLMNRYL